VYVPEGVCHEKRRGGSGLALSLSGAFLFLSREERGGGSGIIVGGQEFYLVFLTWRVASLLLGGEEEKRKEEGKARGKILKRIRVGRGFILLIGSASLELKDGGNAKEGGHH